MEMKKSGGINAADISTDWSMTVDLSKKICVVFFGCILYSAGISLFLDPNEIAPGGVIGLSIILSHVVGGVTGTWYLLLNIPIVLAGLVKFGKKFILTSFLVILLNSFFTNAFSGVVPVTDNPLLASVAGSILMGLGIGMILKLGTTTGGVDIIVRLIRLKHPEIKTSTLFVIVDMAIVALSGLVFRDFNVAMYALISVTIYGRVMDYVLYGGDEARLIYVISDESRRLIPRILEELEVGVTILSGQGAYSSQNKDILMCVVKKRDAIRLKTIVQQEDVKAFLIVSSAREIFGEGYKSLIGEQV